MKKFWNYHFLVWFNETSSLFDSSTNQVLTFAILSQTSIEFKFEVVKIEHAHLIWDQLKLNQIDYLI